jgi:hypothetical protein
MVYSFIAMILLIRASAGLICTDNIDGDRSVCFDFINFLYLFIQVPTLIDCPECTMCMSSYALPMDVGHSLETPIAPHMSGTGERELFCRIYLYIFFEFRHRRH